MFFFFFFLLIKKENFWTIILVHQIQSRQEVLHDREGCCSIGITEKSDIRFQVCMNWDTFSLCKQAQKEKKNQITTSRAEELHFYPSNHWANRAARLNKVTTHIHWIPPFSVNGNCFPQTDPAILQRHLTTDFVMAKIPCGRNECVVPWMLLRENAGCGGSPDANLQLREAHRWSWKRGLHHK